MSVRTRLAAGLLSGGVLLIPNLAKAESSSFSSRISEVDACNQAQYLMPDKAVVQGYRLGNTADKQGPLFNCSVSWSKDSKDSKAMPTNRPILLPNAVQIPIIWNGWL